MSRISEDRVAVLSAESADGAKESELRSAALPGTPENPLDTLLTVPNLITLCRLILTAVCLVLFPIEEYRTVAIAIFIVASSTDWFDGQVARRFHQVSYFGKRFDPIMDRVLIFSGLTALAMGRLVPVWVVVYLVLRDIYLGIGGFLLGRFYSASIDVCYVGKACTFVLMAGFAIVMLGLFPVPGLDLFECSWLPGFGASSVSLGMWTIYVGCILSFSAASIYTAQALRIMRRPR